MEKWSQLVEKHKWLLEHDCLLTREREEVVNDTYPETIETWKHLVAISQQSYRDKIGKYTHSVQNFALRRDKKDFIQVLKDIGKCVEPFNFVHGFDGWPEFNPGRHTSGKIKTGEVNEIGKVYLVNVHNNEVSIERVPIEFGGTERIDVELCKGL